MALRALGEPCAECGHIDWRSEPPSYVTALDKAEADLEQARQKTSVRQYDLLAKQKGEAEALADRFRDALERIAVGRPHGTEAALACESLSGSAQTEEGAG